MDRKVCVNPRGRKNVVPEPPVHRVPALRLDGALEDEDRLVLVRVAMRGRSFAVDHGAVHGQTASGGRIGALHVWPATVNAVVLPECVAVWRSCDFGVHR